MTVRVKGSRLKNVVLRTAIVEILWSRKQLYFGSFGADGQVTERSLQSLRQVDVDVTGVYETLPVGNSENEEIIDTFYNYTDDRVYILKYRTPSNEYRLLKFDPRLMVTEISVVVTVNPGIIDLRLISGSAGDIWLNERYNDGNSHQRMRRFDTATLNATFDADITEYDNLNVDWQTACGSGKISAADYSGPGITIIEITSPTTYTFTTVPLFDNGNYGPNFSTNFNEMRCYNETEDTIWLEYYSSAPDEPYIARVNATTQVVDYLTPPTGKQYEPEAVWWNSYTNTMIMFVGVDGYNTTGCLEVNPNGTIVGIHGENVNGNWGNFRPSGPYITCENQYTGYGTGEFQSGSPDIEPVNLTVDFDDYYGSPNNYRQWDTRAGYWTYVAPRLEPTAEPTPTYTTTPPTSVDLGLISNGWNSGDLVTNTGVTWYKVTYDSQYTLGINILPTIDDPVVLADIAIYDSYGRQVQLRNAQMLAQNEHLPGDYYIAVIITDQGPGNSLTVGYDIYPTPTSLSPYSFQLEATLL